MTFKTKLVKPKYDPWNLIGFERKSHHCKGKKERCIAYVHTGEMIWECECGHTTGWI